MADDYKVVKDTAGKVSSNYSQAFDTGITFELMRAGQKQVVSLINGTIGPDMIVGTQGDDIIMANGTAGASPGRMKPNDYVDGGKGVDMVILPGAQSDWTAKVPNAGGYPKSTNKEFWTQYPQQAYGSTLVLENKKDGSTVTLRHVEQIAFANNKLSFESGRSQPGVEQPTLLPAGVVELDKAIKSGDVKTATTKDLFAQAEKGMAQDQILNARLQSTPRAQELLGAIPTGKLLDEGFDKAGQRLGEQIRKETAPAALNQLKAAPLAPAF